MKIKTILLSCLFMVGIACKKEASHSHKTPSKPIIVLPDGGKEWNVFGVKITGKILSEATDGAYSVIVTDTPPMGGPPPHVHSHEDELFYVLKGHYKFFCGDKVMDAPQGSLVQLPKGIPHHFKNIDTITGITINTITPGGFENFFETIAQISKKGKPSRQQIDSIANTYGMKFVK
ncbi:cupin domain-containing protein [Flavicella sp.]|uniref:cupin domain-containing protein n=1 Tax=Flavicella sp. TaxID=2957742 RepID=UPI0026291EA5|nr:cupin domain-containing protein [Flavicella sp.]MDG1805900.1 cupin domain-containing protein [Flavicella sp.]